MREAILFKCAYYANANVCVCQSRGLPELLPNALVEQV